MLYNIALIRCLEREMGYKIIIHNKNNFKKKIWVGSVGALPVLPVRCHHHGGGIKINLIL